MRIVSFTFQMIIKSDGDILRGIFDKEIKIYILIVSNLSSQGRHFERTYSRIA